MKYKHCTKCKRQKLANIDNFNKRSKNKDGLNGHCRDCVHQSQKLWYINNKPLHNKRTKQWYNNHVDQISVYNKKWWQNNKNKYRWHRIHIKYGLGKDWREARFMWLTMFHKQHGRCAICKKKFSKSNKPHTDHCHKTGEVRGLLCSKCNNDVAMVENHLGRITKYLAERKS